MVRGALALLIGCGACAPAVSTAPRAAARGAPESASGMLGPAEIDRILRESAITYRVSAKGVVGAISVSNILVEQEDPPPRRLDPFIEVDRTDGRTRLRSHLPDADVEPLFSKAGKAFAARDFETARQLYLQAVKTRPGYFKSYTYLGNALYFLGRYAEAKAVFQEALERNPFDYQAHLFMGDTLHQLGHYEEAKHALTIAFLLNRDNEVVQERLRSTLAKVGLGLREARLRPAVRVHRGLGEEVLIRLDREDGKPWYPLAACLACWAYEDQCRDRSTSDDDPLRLTMYRECLLNQAAASAARSERKSEVEPAEKVLLAAIEDGYLEAIVFWEVIAARTPAVMLLLPDTLRDSITKYIERYVYVSTRMVRDEAPPAGALAAR